MLKFSFSIQFSYSRERGINVQCTYFVNSLLNYDLTIRGSFIIDDHLFLNELKLDIWLYLLVVKLIDSKWKIFCSEMKRKVKISVKEGRKIAVIGLRVIPSPATVLHWFLFPRIFWILSFNWLPLSNFLERRRILIIHFHHIHLDSQFLFIHKTFHTVNSLECLGLRGTWDGPDHLLN